MSQFPKVYVSGGGAARLPLVYATLFLQRSLERLADVRLEHVEFLDIVVTGELDAAFQAGFDFLDVVLEALERLDREILGDDRPIADETDLAAALDVAIGAEAACDVAD